MPSINYNIAHHTYLTQAVLKKKPQYLRLIKELEITPQQVNHICQHFFNNVEDRMAKWMRMEGRLICRVVNKIRKTHSSLPEGELVAQAVKECAEEYRFQFILWYVMRWLRKKMEEEIQAFCWLEREQGRFMSFEEAKQAWIRAGYHHDFVAHWANLPDK
jgi:hypothetical protein